jgi:hypothetical protein
MIKIKITLPLLLAVIIAALVWLVRDAGSSSTPARKSTPRRPRRRPRQTIIQPRDGQDNGHVTYEDALRAPAGTYTADDLREMADREAQDAARTAYSAARATQVPNPLRKGAQS